MSNTRTPDQPDKFPLWWHKGSQQWCKKIKGRFCYFGTDREAAFRKYAGIQAVPTTLDGAVKKYLDYQRSRVPSGEVSQRHCNDLDRTLTQLCDIVGGSKSVSLESADLYKWRSHLSETNKAVSLGNHVRRVRSFLTWCIREKFIKEMPPGDGLKKPSKAMIRKARAEQGSRMFTPEEIRKLLTYANPQLRNDPSSTKRGTRQQ